MINTGEYFHGPFETTDKNLAIVLLMNDGRTRPVDERVMNFIQKYAERYSIIDAKDMGVNLFPDSVSEFFNPIAIYPALSQINLIYDSVKQILTVKKENGETLKQMVLKPNEGRINLMDWTETDRFKLIYQ